MPAPRALIALLLLTAACVDVPRRPFAPGAAPPDADPGADAMPFDAAPDADAPLDAEAPDAPLDADADADAPDQEAPDQDPPDHGPATCPAPCAVPGTLAAYLPLERVDAITRLPDGSVMLGGAAPAPELVAYAATLDRPLAAVVHGAIPADGVHPHLPFLLRLTPDLAAVTALHVFNTPGASLSRLAARVGFDGATRLYASSQRGAEAIVDDVIDPIAGYHLIELDPNAPAGITQTGLSAVAAEGDLQTTPIWAPRADRYVVHVTGLALGPGWSAAQLAIPGVAPTAFNGWRHHVSLVPSPEPVRLGVLPPGEWYSVLPFAGALYCPHRSWTVADFQRLAPDGNGGLQRGAWPFDPYGSAHCGRGASPDTRTLPPADHGAHGWTIDATVSAEATDVVVDPATDEFYLAFNARAVRTDAPPLDPAAPPGTLDLVPTITRHARDGSLVWWRRPHPQLVDGQPVASPVPQRILALALDPRPPGALVVLAETALGGPHPLWPAPHDGAPGFQGPPPPVPELAEQPTIGWLGRFTLDGALIAATHVFDPRRDDPANRRPGRLRCWTDTDATAGSEPTTLQLFRQSLAIGPHGEIALRARVARPLTTPDAWQPAPPTADATPVGMELIRVFDADLSTVLYSTVVEATTGDPMPGRTVIVEDITFDVDGRLLVVGRQIALQASGRLPTLAVPSWGRAEPYTIPEAIPAARAFLLRLALDPTCGE